MGLGLAILLTTSISARVRTVVVSLSVLFAVLLSNPSSVSSELTETLLLTTPLMTPRMVTVKLRVAPAGSVGNEQVSVPPICPTVGTVLQVPPAGTVCET